MRWRSMMPAGVIRGLGLGVGLWVFAALSFASPVSAFFAHESERGGLEMRAVVDAAVTAGRNPTPRELYPSAADGQGSTTLRLLMDADMGEAARFRLNAYQGLRLTTESRSLFSGDGGAYRSTYLDVDWSEDADVKMPLAVDELVFKFAADRMDIAVGRQAVGLAVNMIFTPNDIFYAFSPDALDRAFRPGVDAARVDVRITDLSQITLLGVMGYDDEDIPDWENSATLLRASVNVDNTDLIALGGKAAGRYLVGGGLIGELKGAGLRAEGNVSIPSDDSEDVYGQVAGGVDYRWPNTFYLVVEYYYHGNGVGDPDEYLGRMTDDAFLLDPYLGEHYLGVSLSGEVHPLVTLQGVLIGNLLDPSLLVSSGVTYSAADEVELIASAVLPIGRWPTLERPARMLPQLRSEYGAYPFSLFIQTRVYF